MQRAREAPKPLPAPAQAENRLKRETPFIAHIRFKNDLPEIPCDPKLIISSLETDKLSAFGLTEMEKAMRPELVTGPEPGCISLVDIQRYAHPWNQHDKMDQEDQLLVDLANNSKPVLGKDTQLSWLLRTKYMQAHDGTNPAALQQASAASAREELDADTVLQRIEEMFEASKRPPVHPRDPTLAPVEVLPVLPDLDLWTQVFHTTTCDTDLITRMDAPGRGPAELEYLLEHTLLKPYAVKQPNGDKQDIMALVVPERCPPEEELAAAQCAAVEGDYRWVREFNFKHATPGGGGMGGGANVAYCFMLRNGEATYVPVARHLPLSKRRRQDSADIPVPSKITVRRREISEEEMAENKRRMNHLYGVEDPGDAAQERPEEDQADLFSDEEDT